MARKGKAVAVATPLVQGSLEWHAYREAHANASEAPAVMNVGRFQPRNQRELCLERNGTLVKTTNFAMRAGSANESHVLARLRAEMAVNGEKLSALKPEVLSAVIDGIPMSASLDARQGEHSVEVKTCVSPTSPYWTEAKAGRIEESVLWQMTHQYIVGREHGVVNHYLYVELNGVGVMLPYTHDDAREEKLMAGWKAVWPHIINGTVIGDRADAEWEKAAADYLLLHGQKEAVEKMLSDAKDRLVKLANGKQTSGNGVLVKKLVRKGNIDYSGVPQDILDKLPRKPDTEYWQVDRVKDGAGQ